MSYPEDKSEIKSDAIQLSISQKFEMEKMNRIIDNCTNIEDLRQVAKSMLSAWMVQKAATAWMIREQMGRVNEKI